MTGKKRWDAQSWNALGDEGPSVHSETQKQRKIKAHAAYLRKRLGENSEIIRKIVARMSDEELIIAEARHHEMRVKELADKTRTNRIYDGAPALIGQP